VIKKDFIAEFVAQQKYGDTLFWDFEKDSERYVFGFLDNSGDILSAAKSYEISPPLFQDGIGTKKGENGLLGCINYQERWVIPPIYEDFRIWLNGLMPAKKNGKWGYINRSGDVVVDFRFERVHFYMNGLFVARDNSLYGLVDLNGNWITEAIYEGIFYPWSDLICAQKDGKIGYFKVRN